MNIGRNNIHIINKLGHCISAKHIVIKEIGCGLHPDDNYINCSCWKIKMYLQCYVDKDKLKKILIIMFDMMLYIFLTQKQ